MVKIYFFIILSATLNLFGQSTEKGLICPESYWGGIIAGDTPEKFVKKIYGDGVYIDSLGENGARYYTDKNRTNTLIVSFFSNGIEKIVEEIKLIKGFKPPKNLKPNQLVNMTSNFLDFSERFGNWYELSLGVTKNAVKNNLGEPKRIYKEGDRLFWIYESSCNCALEAGRKFCFINDELISVSFFILRE